MRRAHFAPMIAAEKRCLVEPALGDPGVLAAKRGAGIGAQMLLAPRRLDLFAERPCAELHLGRRAATGAAPSVLALDHPTFSNTYCASILTRLSSVYRAEIGRASCRERVCQYV